MDTDLALILGLALAGLALVAMMSAFADNRGPRGSALTVMIAAGLITYALTFNPGGYAMAEIPDVFFSVVARAIP